MLIFALFLLSFQTAQADPCDQPIELSKVANYIYLQGRLCPGDGKKFIQYMSRAGKGVFLIRLNSGGGNGAVAVEIGRYIRANNITTWTDAKQDKCASACNRVFAGGIHRIYSNANHIQTGYIQAGKNPKEQFGLGYHHPAINGDFRAAEDWYEKGIVPYLKEMLPPKAFAWVYQTDRGNMTPKLIWLNGAQALELGIATSSNAPR
jgi:hypothetical protein